MGTPQKPLKTTLFMGIMFREGFAVPPLMDRLRNRFGPAEFSYGPVPFSWTDYYAAEMGENLFKTYICFESPVERELLPEIKQWTNGIEQEYAAGGRRAVNIDPGYLARDKLVLASTKDFYHRLYLGQGIYGEVTLHFRQGRFRYFSWTYPDFKEEKLQEFLMKARAKLVGELRKG
jgi:hypothetical protein